MRQHLEKDKILRAKLVIVLALSGCAKQFVVAPEAYVFSAPATGMLCECQHTTALYETSQSIQPFFVERRGLSDYMWPEYLWREAY
jgi:hypothetical protein